MTRAQRTAAPSECIESAFLLRIALLRAALLTRTVALLLLVLAATLLATALPALLPTLLLSTLAAVLLTLAALILLPTLVTHDRLLICWLVGATAPPPL